MEYDINEQVMEYTPRKARNRNNQEEQKPNIMIRVVRVQIIVFIIISLVFFGLYRKQNAVFSQLKTMYSDIMQVDLSAAEIKGKIQSVMGYLSHPNGYYNKDNSEEESTQTNEEFNGAGGEDLIHAKGKTSFSPFYLSKKITKPVEAKRVSSEFGYRENPVTHEYGFHSGIDLSAAEGTPIYAAFDGTVKKASNSPKRGNYIILSSSDSIETVYCHASELLVADGQQVKAGETIAKVGSTGQVTGPHLHFEIHINGKYCNPRWVLDY